MLKNGFKKKSNTIPEKLLKKRHAKEARFKFYGLATIVLVISVLAILLFGIVAKGYKAFYRSTIITEVYLDPVVIKYDPANPRTSLAETDFSALLTSPLSKEETLGLYSANYSIELFQYMEANPQLIGTKQKIKLTANDNVDRYLRKPLNKSSLKLTKHQMDFVADLKKQKLVKKEFNKAFFTSGDSREPERAGIFGAIVGSVYVIIVALLVAFPLGIGTAIFLEEFAPKNSIINSLEVNIANLAAVPSIIFGLMGLAVFINFMSLPRSSALVGGLTLALMTLPTIVITARSALQTVPLAIKQAAQSLGASPIQMVFQQVLPIAMPGIMTGTIIGTSRALGETAPLLMIGMVAFIIDIPDSLLEPATVLPVQIFNWARNPEPGFIENTAAAIMVLLLFIIIMNLGAIILRKKYEHKW